MSFPSSPHVLRLLSPTLGVTLCGQESRRRKRSTIVPPIPELLTLKSISILYSPTPSFSFFSPALHGRSLMDQLYSTRRPISPQMPAWMRRHGDMPYFSNPSKPPPRLSSPIYPSDGSRSFRPGQSTRLPDPLEVTQRDFNGPQGYPPTTATQDGVARKDPYSLQGYHRPFTRSRPFRLKDPWMEEYQKTRRYPIISSPSAPKIEAYPATPYPILPSPALGDERYLSKMYTRPHRMTYWEDNAPGEGGFSPSPVLCPSQVSPHLPKSW